METLMYFILAFFLFNIETLSLEQVAITCIVILAVAVIFNLIYYFIHCGRYKNILQKMGIYIKTKDDEVAVIRSRYSDKFRVIEDDGFVFPGNKIVFISTSLQTIDLSLDTVVYKDFKQERLSISIAKRPMNIPENFKKILSGISEKDMRVNDEKVKIALRNYFISVNSDDWDRLKVIEIIKETICLNGCNLHAVSITKLL